MTSMHKLATFILFVVPIVSSVHATFLHFINKCSHDIQLWDNINLVLIPEGGDPYVKNASGGALMWRDGQDPEATLAEFSIPGDGKAWYDISIVPPGSDWCGGFEECRAYTGKTGFNVGIDIIPHSNVNGDNCRALHCPTDGCEDAYQFPKDDWKTHSCPDTTEFDIVFCPINNNSGGSSSDTTALTSSSYFKANYIYTGAQAGNVPGYYDMVANLQRCEKLHVGPYCNPVGPLSDEVSMIFRGPIELFHIAVYLGRSGQTTWDRVSWYQRGGEAENLVFLNNLNVDYSGNENRGPQGYASSDGKYSVEQPEPFQGTLAEAAYPELVGGGPGIDTGVEVNIMTATRCSFAKPCAGFFGYEFSHHGWGGGRKIFVVQVQMPWGVVPNQPAIWLLNAQVLHSGQYSGCNCRGMGAVGGCGELDIAEVIETNTARDKISTHYYFYDGSVPPKAGGDNFASRPMDKPTVYLVIIDDDAGEGTIKILEVEQFDFDQLVLTDAQVQEWIGM